MPRRAGLCLSALCTFTLIAPAGAVTQIDPHLLQALKWRSIGPFRGGRALAATGVPGQPDHFYFGAVNGGVWETHNAGRTWDPIFDSAAAGSIGALAVAPSNPNVIYVGTGEADMRSDIAQGEGMFKSIDGGRSWQKIGLEDSRQIGRILVDPTNADVLLAAALGHPYGPNEMRGVFRSIDGGNSWQRTLYRDPSTGAIDLAAEPGNPSIVYAALWQTRRPPWSVYPPSNGAGGGLYKSRDGGQTWTRLTGLPDRPGRIGIALSSANPHRVYALIDAAEGGLYRSDDGGDSWVHISRDARIWNRGWYFGGITVDPKNADVVYICNTALYRSDDAGNTFIPVKGAPGGDDYHQLWIDPTDDRRRILATDQGTVITVDAGATWSSWYNQPTGQFYHVAIDHRFPYWVYGAQQDSGSAAVPSRTDNIDGINLTEFREVAVGGESDNIASTRGDPPTLYGGRVEKFDPRTGQTRRIDPTLAYPGLYRSAWTLPLALAERDRAVYFGNQRIFRSTNGGLHWQVISPDLSRKDAAVPLNLDPATLADDEHPTSRRGVVYALAPSPLDYKLVWAGTDDGMVWRTADGGTHWQDVTPHAITSWSKIGMIEPSHFDSRSAYLAVDRHRLDDPAPYIYRTHDAGATWTLIVDGIGEPGAINSVNVVREDAGRRGVLYCGTEHGVYLSVDDGAHWQPLQQNLPRTSVRDLDVHASDLVIATHGRGFWIMDDVALLRALAADASGTARLFPPALAYRVRPTGFTGTPMPKDEPLAANPALGALIDYVLDGTSEETVTLRILDASGALVRTVASSDKPKAPRLDKMDIAPEWLAAEPLPESGAGAHRFVWDLHYAPPQALWSDQMTDEDREMGVWAPPGEYWVELQTREGRYRQPLTLAADPRVKLPASAYRQEFELARAIEASRVQIAVALSEAQKLHEAISKASKLAEGADAAVLYAADRQLVAMDVIAPAKASPDFLGRPPASVQGLRYLAAAFARLALAVDGADGAPTPDALRSYRLNHKLLSAALETWARFKSEGLARKVLDRTPADSQ